jgi:hypothetical protein
METKITKQGSTLILKAVVILIGIIGLALCLIVLPAGIMTDKVGYYRPILIGLYIPAVPFFYAIYQTLKLLNYIDKNLAFSELSIDALQKIKYSALSISVMFAVGMPYIFYAAQRDDAPGVVAIGLIIILASFVIAVFAAVLRRILHNAFELKSENDLTV